MLQDTITNTEESITEKGLKNCSAKLLPSGTVLISIFATVGRTATLAIDAATNQAIVGVIPNNKSDFDPRFLEYSLQVKARELQNKSRGVAQVNINGSVLKQTEIPLPPLAEQQRIAAILDTADAVRKKRQEALALTDQFLQATFLDMFGDPVTNPKGWETCTVGDVTDCIVPGRDKPKSFTGPIPWITTDDVVDLETTYVSSKGIGLRREEIAEVKARVIPTGSVIISCVGDLGICSVAGCDLVVNQQLHTFQCGDRINAKFLVFCLTFQKPWMKLRATKTTLPYINKTKCNSIPVVVPPLALQHRFSQIVETTERKKASQRADLAELDTLFNALVQRAFRGDL